MTTSGAGAAVRGGGPASSIEPGRGLRRGWRAVTALIVAAVFAEAALAGAMMSGAGWARPGHGALAAVLVASTLVTGLVAVVALRRVPHGRTLGLTLLALGGGLLVQGVLGALTAKGLNLFWLHVPLGVALVGLAGRAAAVAGRLGGD